MESMDTSIPTEAESDTTVTARGSGFEPDPELDCDELGQRNQESDPDDLGQRDEESDPRAVGQPKKERKNTWRIGKKVITIGVCAIVLGLTGAWGYHWYQDAASHEETDDAYITGSLHQVSTRLDGTVEKIWVDDNEQVTKGQILVSLDPRDYQVKLEQALANLKQAERQVQVDRSSVRYQNQDALGQATSAEGSRANALAAITRSEALVRETEAAILARQAEVTAKEAELDRAKADWMRFEHLANEGAVTLSQRDSAKRDYLVAVESRNAARDAVTQATERLVQAQQTVNTSKAQLTQAQAQKELAEATAVQVEVDQAKVAADLAAVAKAKAAVDEAKLNLSYTRLVAPISGRIGKKTVQVGHRVQPGEPLVTVVAGAPWVVANFKETQLERMQVGQKVSIKVDALPNHKFEGRILSFSPASGSSFAVLPSDNATGNFTKIVQRLPVKIVFDSSSTRGFEDRLAPGLSVVASVDLNHKLVNQNRLAEHRHERTNWNN